MAEEILIVDIGGVIITHACDESGAYHLLPDVIEVLKKLKAQRFGDRIFVVSHASEEMESDMLWFLWQNMFCDKTKISIDNFYFCRQRIQKAKICLELSATHVIDDRKEVLAYLHDVGIKNLYLFQEREQEQGKFMEVVPLVKPVASWQEVAKELLS